MTTASHPLSHDHPSADELAWLHALARRMAQPWEDPEDLAQQAWLCASAAATPPTRRRPWLVGILRNRWRMGVRQGQRRSAREQTAGAVTTVEHPLPDAVVHAQAVAQAIRSAMDELPPGDRELLEQRFWADCSPTELAEQLGVPPSTLRTRLQRALQRVRAGVERRIGGAPQHWSVALAASGRGGTGASTGMTAGVTAKLATGVMAVAVGIGVGWPACNDSPDDRPLVAEAPAGDAELSGAGVLADAVGEARDLPARAPDPHAAQMRWQALRDRIQRAQATGDGAKEAASRRPPAAGRELSNATEEGDSSQLIALLGPSLEGIEDGAAACVGDLDPQGRAGRLSVGITLIGEPGIGAVIESLKVDVDTPKSAELLECFESMVYTLELPNPSVSLMHDLNIMLDLEHGTSSIGWPMTADNAAEMFKRFPELGEIPADAFVEMFEDAKIADTFRAAVAADPTLVERVPALAAALEQARGSARP